MLSRFVASAAARLRGKVHVGTDALGNAYYSRPHPRIAGKEIREVLPAAGGRLEAAAGYTDDDGRRPGLLSAAAGGPVG